MATKFLNGISTNALQLGTTATAGYVMTADSSGNASWQAATGGGTTKAFAIAMAVALG